MAECVTPFRTVRYGDALVITEARQVSELGVRAGANEADTKRGLSRHVVVLWW